MKPIVEHSLKSSQALPLIPQEEYLVSLEMLMLHWPFKGCFSAVCNITKGFPHISVLA